MQTKPIISDILSVRYLGSNDKQCTQTVAVTVKNEHGAKRTIYLHGNNYDAKILCVGTSVVIQEQRDIYTNFVPKYNMIVAHKKNTKQK